MRETALTDLDFATVREQNLAHLSQRGFRVPSSLAVAPRREGVHLRPPAEIARRLWALHCLFDYVAAPTKTVPTMKICKCMLRSDLRGALTQDELFVIDGWRSKAQRRHIETIGWRLENMLPLAWILGFDGEPDVDGIMLEGEPAKQLVSGFLGSLEQNVAEWLSKRTLRCEREVVQREDLCYCAYQAVRLAREGDAHAVPADFDLLSSGGVIQERLHALSWALSPGVEWSDIELSA